MVNSMGDRQSGGVATPGVSVGGQGSKAAIVALKRAVPEHVNSSAQREAIRVAFQRKHD